MGNQTSSYGGPCPERFLEADLVVDPCAEVRAVFLLYPPAMKATAMCRRYRVFFN